MKHGEALAKRGVEVTWLPVDGRGLVDLHDAGEGGPARHGDCLGDVGEQRDRRAFADP